MASVTQFKSTEDIQVIDFSKLKYLRPLDINDEKYDADVRQFLQRVLALFMTPVYNEDYCITQKIANYFCRKCYIGFRYRSFYTNGNNYIFFDDTMKCF